MLVDLHAFATCDRQVGPVIYSRPAADRHIHAAAEAEQSSKDPFHDRRDFEFAEDTADDDIFQVGDDGAGGGPKTCDTIAQGDDYRISRNELKIGRHLVLEELLEFVRATTTRGDS